MKRTGYLKVFLDWQERFRKLSDAELGRLIRAALTYMREGVVPQLTGREELVFDGVRPKIDRDKEAYDATCEARRRAGKAGAEARWKADGKNGKSHFEHGKNGQEEEKDKEEEQDKDALLRAQARGARAEQKTFTDADAVAKTNGFAASNGRAEHRDRPVPKRRCGVDAGRRSRLDPKDSRHAFVRLLPLPVSVHLTAQKGARWGDFAYPKRICFDAANAVFHPICRDEQAETAIRRRSFPSKAHPSNPKKSNPIPYVLGSCIQAISQAGVTNRPRRCCNRIEAVLPSNR